MATAMRMSAFLQRMLRKNDDEVNDESSSSKSASPSKGSKSSWMKKFGNYSPGKYDVTGSALKTRSLENLNKKNYRSNSASTIPGTIAVLPNPPLEMPDLESIIREFEKGFMSPEKNDGPSTSGNRGNFVKKIVAAFEVKYKEYNDLKAGAEAKERAEIVENARRGEGRKFGWSMRRNQSKMLESLKIMEEEKKGCEVDGGKAQKLSSPSKVQTVDSKGFHKKFGICLSPFKAARETTKSGGKSLKMLLTPSKVKVEAPKKNGGKIPLDLGNNCREENSFEEGSMDHSTPQKNDFEDSEYLHERPESDDNSSQKSYKKSKFNITWPYAPDESSFITDESVTMIEELVAIDKMLEKRREAKGSNEKNDVIDSEDNGKKEIEGKVVENCSVTKEKFGPKKNKDAPRIVGAFLKKPIEVDDTAIDWIPITGERLPRKRSLKKIFSVLKSKRVAVKRRNSVLLTGEGNVDEEQREFQDSGYEEKSSSSSSLTSLISITDVLLEQEVSRAEPNRRSATLKTFRGKNNHRNSQRIKSAKISSERTNNRKNLLLSEVPREVLPIDHDFPVPFVKIVKKSDVDESDDEDSFEDAIYVRPLPKHPAILRYPKLPKHPYVSTQSRAIPVNDENEDFGLVKLRAKNCSLDSIVKIRNSLYEVEFRRSFDGFPCSTTKRDSCLSTESIYDVPRRFLSKSETGIADIVGFNIDAGKNDPIYDVPRPRVPERPRSSIYEDAVSLRRRTNCSANVFSSVDDSCLRGDGKFRCPTIVFAP